jgi:hypothetical protein
LVLGAHVAGSVEELGEELLADVVEGVETFSAAVRGRVASVLRIAVE